MSGDSNIDPGDLAIFTDFDRPCARLLVIVTEVRGDVADILYVRLGRAIKSVPVSELTCIEDFGLRVNDFDKDGDLLLLLEQTNGPRSARYKHGERSERIWQGDMAVVVHIDARAQVGSWY